MPTCVNACTHVKHIIVTSLSRANQHRIAIGISLFYYLNISIYNREIEADSVQYDSTCNTLHILIVNPAGAIFELSTTEVL